MDPKTPKQIRRNAVHKLLTIAEALKQGSKKEEYIPVFNISGGGFSFCGVDAGTWRGDGNRRAAAGLCVQDVDTAKFFGTQEELLPIWKVFINN